MITFIYVYFEIGALLLFSTVAWYGYRFTRHYSVADVQEAIAGKKKPVDPAVTTQLARDAKLCRRITGYWFVSFIVLVVVTSVLNTLIRK